MRRCLANPRVNLLLSNILSGISSPLMRFVKRATFASIIESKNMAKKCSITGKKPMVGNNVSHANNKTKRRYLPNLQYKRFWLDAEKRFVRLRVSTRGMRIIDKHGIEAVLKDMKLRDQIAVQ